MGGETSVTPEKSREWYKAHAPEVWAAAKAAAATAAAAAAASGGGRCAPAAAAGEGAGGVGTGLQFKVDEGAGAAAPAATAAAPQPPKAAHKLPSVSTLNYFFPPGTPQRELLEGLVGPPAPRGGGGGGGGGADKQRCRFSAAQALAWFAESPWRDLKTPGDA